MTLSREEDEIYNEIPHFLKIFACLKKVRDHLDAFQTMDNYVVPCRL